MSEYSTSMAMIAVPIGDRKMADSPAAIPTRSSSRRSLASQWRSPAYHDATPAVISATGPSRPAAPPDPMVMADATSFTGATRPRSSPLAW